MFVCSGGAVRTGVVKGGGGGGGGRSFCWVLLVGLKLKTLCDDLVPSLMFFYFHLVESFGAFVSFLGGVDGGRGRGLFLVCCVGCFGVRGRGGVFWGF